MNLILRTVASPYGDTTLGSVLSQQNVDNNFINLKGELIYTASTSSNNLYLDKISGEQIVIALPANVSASVIGCTYDSSSGTLTLNLSDS